MASHLVRNKFGPVPLFPSRFFPLFSNKDAYKGIRTGEIGMVSPEFPPNSSPNSWCPPNSLVSPEFPRIPPEFPRIPEFPPVESAVYRYYIGLRKGQIVKDGYEALKEVVGNKALRQWLVDNIKSHIVAGQLCEFFERVKIPGEVSIDDVNEYPKLLVCLSHESSLSNLNHHLFQPDLASTKQNGEKAKSKGRGRPQKYDEKFLRRVYATFEQKYRVTGHKKQAWHETAAEHKLKSGKAAEIACRRYLKNQNKKQN